MTRRRNWIAGLLLATGLVHAAEFDLQTLLARIARPLPDTVDFCEVRYSHLLKSPLAVTGTLERGQDGALVRRIESPYRETTEVRGNDVVIRRDGAYPRKFSLDRAPELEGMLGSIGAMLRGDAAMLERFFTPSLEGAPDRWRVRLVPKDERLHRRLSDITVYGTDAVVNCFAMNQPAGDASIIALGVRAAVDMPHANRDQLEAWCRGGGRP